MCLLRICFLSFHFFLPKKKCKPNFIHLTHTQTNNTNRFDRFSFFKKKENIVFFSFHFIHWEFSYTHTQTNKKKKKFISFNVCMYFWRMCTTQFQLLIRIENLVVVVVGWLLSIEPQQRQWLNGISGNLYINIIKQIESTHTHTQLFSMTNFFFLFFDFRKRQQQQNFSFNWIWDSGTKKKNFNNKQTKLTFIVSGYFKEKLTFILISFSVIVQFCMSIFIPFHTIMVSAKKGSK